MDSTNLDLAIVSATDDSVSTAVFTPPDSVLGQPEDTPVMIEQPPQPGSTYIIACAGSNAVLTLIEGQVRMLPLSGKGSVLWLCKERDGWLGFCNLASGKYLGYNEHSKIRCTKGHHQHWEYFVAHASANRTYILKQPHKDKDALIAIGDWKVEQEQCLGKHALQLASSWENTMWFKFYKIEQPENWYAAVKHFLPAIEDSS